MNLSFAVAGWLSLCSSEHSFVGAEGQSGESDFGLSHNGLRSSLGALHDDLVEQCVGDHARARSPQQVVVNATEAIIAIDSYRLDCLALTIRCKSWSMLHLHVKVSHLSDTDVLVETELFLLHLNLVELLNACCVDLCAGGLAKLKNLFVLFLPLLEFRDNKRELCQLRLSLLFDRGAHSLENRGLMQRISVHLVARGLVFLLNLGVEIGVDVSIELPNVDSIVLCCGNHHSIVQRVEHSAHYRVSVTNKGLEEVRNCFLGIVVPHFEQVVLTSCEHIAAIV